MSRNNTWGSLCSDSWDVEDTSVACKQLGYTSESKRQDYMKGSDPEWSNL